MKIIHITHTDLDGAGCVLLAKQTFANESYNYFIANYGDYLDRVFTNEVIKCVYDIDLVLFTDISPTVDQIKYLDSKGIIYQVIDHHDTARELHNGQNIIVHESSISGTLGTYLWLTEMFKSTFSPELERLVYVINIWDTYQEDSPDFEGARDLAMYVGFVGLDTYIQDNTVHLFTLNSLIRRRDSLCKKIKYFSEVFAIGDISIGMAVSSDFISDVAHVLLGNGCTYAIITDLSRLSISLRGSQTSTIHLGELMSELADTLDVVESGGGHERAAGCKYRHFLDFNDVLLEVIEAFKNKLK